MFALEGDVKVKFFTRVGFFKSLSWIHLCTILFLVPVCPAFSVENIDSLIRQGDAAVTRGDFEQVKLLGQRIVDEAPRNLEGYRFVLIYLVSVGNERGFNQTVDYAKTLFGSDRLQLSFLEMVARVLFAGGQSEEASKKLSEYEANWREVYKKSRPSTEKVSGGQSRAR